MLFDLQGKRRRVVQGTYLMLAVLMGGGLVLFGIGSSTNGGLFDAFTGGGGSNGNSGLEKRIKRNEGLVAKNIRPEAAHKALARDYYQLAATNANADGTFPADSKKDLAKAGANWEAYLALQPKKVDASLANLAVQAYAPTALNKPKQAETAALIVAKARPTSNAYLQVVALATAASDTRVADLAGQKAIDLAPKGQRAQAKKLVKQAKQPPQQQGAGAAPSGG
jgi:hypothetical protein